MKTALLIVPYAVNAACGTCQVENAGTDSDIRIRDKTTQPKLLLLLYTLL